MTLYTSCDVMRQFKQVIFFLGNEICVKSKIRA